MTVHRRPDEHADPLEPITQAWTDQEEADVPAQLIRDPLALADSVAEAHRKDRRKLLWLNIREVVPSLAVATLFGLFTPGAIRPAATLAATLLVLAVAGFLVVTSVLHERADRRWGESVRDQLARRLAQVEHRARMYRNIAWWYLLPLAAAIVLFRYGLGDELTDSSSLAYYGFCLVFFVGLYWINRRHGRSTYEPELERLESLLSEFDRAVEPGPDHDPQESS